MARLIFPHDNVGEAVAYIKALTGVQSVTIPSAPNPTELGQVLKVESKFLSVDSAVDIGFGFGSVNASTDAKVLLQDYWFSKEVMGTIPEVNSWTFAVGFRVGIKIVAFKANMDVGLGALAAKAETEGLNIQLHILRVGMPLGPNVPDNLAAPVEFNVEKFGELRAWQREVLKYYQEKRSELAPMLVSASVNINGEKLLTESPGVRFALWRISKGMKLVDSIALLTAGKAPEVDQSSVRSIYAAVFNDPTMTIPAQPSEKRKPGEAEIKAANKWLTGYKDIQ